MDKKSVIKLIDLFNQGMRGRGIHPTKIILYGSYATGMPREDSDIDIVVISEDFKNKSYWERIDILADVIYELFAPIEAVALTSEEWEQGDSFVTDFAHNGEVLYSALGVQS